MNITHELRKYATVSWDPWPEARDRLLQMCDRIDAEHQKTIREFNNFVDASVLLPVDADGEVIHIGDEMEFSAFEIEKPVTRMVDGIGQDVFFAWCGERDYQQHEAKRYRHYHVPTVEDVLREFAEKITDSQIPNVHPTYEEAISEYATKLRLADDREE